MSAHQYSVNGTKSGESRLPSTTRGEVRQSEVRVAIEESIGEHSVKKVQPQLQSKLQSTEVPDKRTDQHLLSINVEHFWAWPKSGKGVDSAWHSRLSEPQRRCPVCVILRTLARNDRTPPYSVRQVEFWPRHLTRFCLSPSLVMPPRRSVEISILNLIRQPNAASRIIPRCRALSCRRAIAEARLQLKMLSEINIDLYLTDPRGALLCTDIDAVRKVAADLGTPARVCWWCWCWCWCCCRWYQHRSTAGRALTSVGH